MSQARTPLGRLAMATALTVGLAATSGLVAHADPPPSLGIEGNAPAPEARGTPPTWSGKAFRQGVVSVANPYAAEAGATMLEQGGNAVDAAVAVAYALNVVEPQSSGIGGGGFMLIHRADTGETVAIDSRETAPAGATPDMFVDVPRANLQGVAVGVPGMVRGTDLALQEHGRLTLAEVIQPAIALADEGFAATPRYSDVSCNSRTRNSPEAEAFFCPDGEAPPVGSLVRNEPLADTFRLLAEHGADCFYEYRPEIGCDIAQGVVEGQQFDRPQEPGGKGGTMTLEDLEDYQAVVRTPTTGTYRGYQIASMSAPSSGGLTMIQMLKMLEQFPIGDVEAGFGFGSPDTVNVMAEAMRLSFADRSIWMGDSDFVPVPSTGLLHPGYVEGRAAQIVPGQRIDPDPEPGDPRPWEYPGSEPGVLAPGPDPVAGPGGRTTHFSVADRWGNLVSYTNTVEASHGIGVFAGYDDADGHRSFGFLLNNELTDFNRVPTVNPYTGEPGYNDVEPGKRPRSSMNPTMIFSPDGEPLVALGSPGGSTIINSVLNVTMNLVDHGMTLQEAVDAPRVSVTGAGSSVSLEDGFPAGTPEALEALGYSVRTGSTIGSVQAVALHPQNGKQYGAADARREGTVIGLPRP